jgi:glutamate-1-semialdehyde aminotransferase
MVRFSKTGSEVTSAAIRAARAYTGRDHIAFRGYHGWHEWYTVTTERPKGIPKVYSQYMHEFEYNNIGSLEKILKEFDIAAIIMEPMIVEFPKDNFLFKVQGLSRKYGAVLIFDEIVTGFRWDIGGAQKYFNVIPDMATFGKGMANGMPVSAVVGREDIMKQFEDVFFSTTQGGECLSLVAAYTTIHEMIDKDYINHIAKLGIELEKGFIGMNIKTAGVPQRLAITENFTVTEKTILIQELIKRGILFHNNLYFNLTLSHTVENIKYTLEAFKQVIEGLRENKFKLEGQLLQPAFKRL